MDALEARDHVRMIDGILRTADRSVHISPVILIAVGVICSTAIGLVQARQLGMAIPPDQYIQPPLFLTMVAIIGLTAWKGRHAGRGTLVDSYAATVFFVVGAVAMTLNLTAQHRIVSAAGMGLFWAAGFSAALLIVGAMGSRPLVAGGLAMLAATGAASLIPAWLPGLLAAGWFMGFVIPGIVLALGASRGRTAAL